MSEERSNLPVHAVSSGSPNISNPVLRLMLSFGNKDIGAEHEPHGDHEYEKDWEHSGHGGVRRVWSSNFPKAAHYAAQSGSTVRGGYVVKTMFVCHNRALAHMHPDFGKFHSTYILIYNPHTVVADNK